MILVLDILARRGAAMYGHEPVTQLEHALQCAHLAERDGAPEELVVAALLHDIGHLVGRFETMHDEERLPERDYAHENSGAEFLRAAFGSEVAEPVLLHVDAKRYLCAEHPGYLERLSPASKHSLELQGGVFTTVQAIDFCERPFAEDAVRLRRWDDAAKVPGAATPDLAHYAAIVERVLQRAAA